MHENGTLSLAAEVAMGQTNDPRAMPTVALIPAAGQARRLGRLPGSKELLPVGFQRAADGAVQPRVALHYLLDPLVDAGVERAYLLLRDGKWDIPAYFGSGQEVGLPLAYITGEPTASVPATLDRAFPFVSDARVVLGFPDVLFEPAGAFRRLLEHQARTNADIVLGLFPATDCRSTDMVEVDDEGRVRRIEVRPRSTDLSFNWLIAVWMPRFTRFLHNSLSALHYKDSGEFQLGTLFQEALHRRMDLRGVPFPRGSFLDLGTPENLAEAQRRHAKLPPAPE